MSKLDNMTDAKLKALQDELNGCRAVVTAQANLIDYYQDNAYFAIPNPLRELDDKLSEAILAQCPEIETLEHEQARRHPEKTNG